MFARLLICVAILGSASRALHAGFETWTSHDGRTIRAEILSVDRVEESARFLREDGLEFTIDFSQLIENDVAKLRASSREAPTSRQASQEPELILPRRLELDDVPMVVQKGNYCVPASAAMIAGFHGIDTDQDQIAELSSAMSAGNQGTYPADMLLAMEKLGFTGQQIHWNDAARFEEHVLGQIKSSLFENGPVYISFRPGVFGDSGHGCVIVGYNDRKQEFIIHNPWGNVFEESYETISLAGRGVVLIDPPLDAPVANERFINEIAAFLPSYTQAFLNVPHRLEQSGIAHDLIWCSRADSRGDKRFAKDTARENGRQILELAFERNPAVIIPHSPDGNTRALLFVTRPETGARFLVREIDASGWSSPSLWTLGKLTRHWPTRFEAEDSKVIWELPMIELHPAT